MPRLIDADELQKIVQELMQKEAEQGYINSAHYALRYMNGLVQNAPTVDAVEVVRCCECIHATTTAMGEHVKYCERFSRDDAVCFDKDFFCGFGKRKDGDG